MGKVDKMNEEQLTTWVQKRINWDYEPTEHDDLFGENPDDAYRWGIDDGEQEMFHDLAAFLGLTKDSS